MFHALETVSTRLYRDGEPDAHLDGYEGEMNHHRVLPLKMPTTATVTQSEANVNGIERLFMGTDRAGPP